MQLKIYCAHPITGLSGEEVIDYYTKIHKTLGDIGYHVFQPMTAKGFFRPETKFKSCNYENGNPVSTNRAIFGRDHWMVRNSDITLVDLTKSKNVSIGCCMELAWAVDGGKHIIIVMEKDNIHRHAFTLEAADIIFETLDEALEYLRMFCSQEME